MVPHTCHRGRWDSTAELDSEMLSSVSSCQGHHARASGQVPLRLSCRSYLWRGALLQGDISIKTDLQQGGAKAPFVGRGAEAAHILHTLRCDPRDPVHTLYREGRSKEDYVWG